jgi:hypothetical protein
MTNAQYTNTHYNLNATVTLDHSEEVKYTEIQEHRTTISCICDTGKRAVVPVAEKKKKMCTFEDEYPSASQQNTANCFSTLWGRPMQKMEQVIKEQVKVLGQQINVTNFIYNN